MLRTHSGVAEDSGLVGCYTVSLGAWFLILILIVIVIVLML